MTVENRHLPALWVGSLVSAGLWVCSLFVPVFYTKMGPVTGVGLLACGAFGILALVPGWYANPLLIPLHIALWRRPPGARLTLSLVTFALAATTFLLTEVPGFDIDAPITTRGPGFYLWIASVALMVPLHAWAKRQSGKAQSPVLPTDPAPIAASSWVPMRPPAPQAALPCPHCGQISAGPGGACPHCGQVVATPGPLMQAPQASPSLLRTYALTFIAPLVSFGYAVVLLIFISMGSMSLWSFLRAIHFDFIMILVILATAWLTSARVGRALAQRDAGELWYAWNARKRSRAAFNRTVTFFVTQIAVILCIAAVIHFGAAV